MRNYLDDDDTDDTDDMSEEFQRNRDISERFQRLRDEWALRWPYNKSTIEMHQGIDRNKNPYNEPYHDKAKRRSEAEIMSDCAYTFADDALSQQYGYKYRKWLETNYKQNRFTKVWQKE